MSSLVQLHEPMHRRAGASHSWTSRLRIAQRLCITATPMIRLLDPTSLMRMNCRPRQLERIVRLRQLLRQRTLRPPEWQQLTRQTALPSLDVQQVLRKTATLPKRKQLRKLTALRSPEWQQLTRQTALPSPDVQQVLRKTATGSLKS